MIAPPAVSDSWRETIALCVLPIARTFSLSRMQKEKYEVFALC